jgi:hypothetical protein
MIGPRACCCPALFIWIKIFVEQRSMTTVFERFALNLIAAGPPAQVLSPALVDVAPRSEA